MDRRRTLESAGCARRRRVGLGGACSAVELGWAARSAAGWVARHVECRGVVECGTHSGKTEWRVECRGSEPGSRFGLHGVGSAVGW